MTLTLITLRPTTTAQAGVGTLGGGALNAASALADSSDLTYVQITGRARLDSDVVRVGFAAPSIPAGARVYSVQVRRRVLTTVPVAGTPVPVSLHWHRCAPGAASVAGEQAQVRKLLFTTPCPTSTDTATYVEEALGEYRVGPDGALWDPATNLSSYNASTNPGGYTYDFGRGDTETSTFRVSAVYLDVYYQQRSVVTATAPTGTVTATRPTVTWTYTSADQQPQQAYRVAIYTSAQVAAPGFAPFVTTPLNASGASASTPSESWWVLGEDLSWTATADLTDGSYQAYVQAIARWAGAGGDFTTATSLTAWTRTATPASPPATAVLNSAVFDSTNYRVALTFTPGGASPATTAFSVQVSRDNGLTWEVPPSLEHIPANGMSSVVAYDNIPPMNVTSRYRVIAFSQSVLVAAAAPSNELSALTFGDRHRLQHPSNPLLSTVLPVQRPKSADDGIKVTLRQQMAVYQLIGGEGQQVLPRAVFGPTYGREWELRAFFADDDLDDLHPALMALVRGASPVRFLEPDGSTAWVVIGPGASGRDTTDSYDAVPGAPSRVYWRRTELTLTECDAPSFY